MTISQGAVAQDQAEQVPHPSGLRDAGEALQGCCVLLVDDDPGVLRLVARVFSRAGAIVSEAQSATEAFEVLQNVQPQLLVSDINMPSENGYSLMRRIRARELQRGGALPSIALSGDDNPLGRHEAMRAGFNAYLSKPFSSEALIDLSIGLLAPNGAYGMAEVASLAKAV